MSELQLSPAEIDYILSPRAVRERAGEIFGLCEKGGTNFAYHADRLGPAAELTLEVTRANYPTLEIPFHSRWGHFRAGKVDRVQSVNRALEGCDLLERARRKLDLVITSVLLDAGAGMQWHFEEDGRSYRRSEGLGVASLHMFLAGKMAGDGKSPLADAAGLQRVSVEDLRQAFQVSAQNPLVGVEGRVQLLNNLGRAVSVGKIFRDGRPGSILDYVMGKHGRSVPATALLRAVLDGFGPIWPSRLSAGGVNLGDVWRYPPLGASGVKGLVPFHKLSQWMTYSLIEPILEAGVEVTGVHELTGLAEYRNGGLFVDAGVITLRDPAKAQPKWEPGSELVIEWRALTVHLLDLVGVKVREALGKSAEEFPLAKALEGGTWWAGRRLAQEKRPDGGPPLNIVSDGTVF